MYDSKKSLNVGKLEYKANLALLNMKSKATLKADIMYFIQDEDKGLMHKKDYRHAINALIKSRLNLIKGIVDFSFVPVVYNDWELKAGAILEDAVT
jgi:hypothetical protein